MDESQLTLIRLYYESFGYDEAKIAGLLSVPVTVVKKAAADGNWVLPAIIKPEVETAEEVAKLSMAKRLALLPHYARAEITILEKILLVANEIDVNDPGAPKALADISKSFQALTGGMYTQKIDESAGKGGGIVVQIMNRLEA